MTALARVLTIVTLSLIIALGSVGCDSAQPPKGGASLPPGQKADNEPKAPESPESKVLDKLVGAWGPSTNDFKAMQAKWALDGTYVQIDKHFDDKHNVDTMSLIAWDKEKGVYRCWQFGRLDGGSPEQGEGTWDDKSNTLTFSCVPRADGRVHVIAYAVSGDRVTYTEGPRDEAGEVKWELTCEWNKRKS